MRMVSVAPARNSHPRVTSLRRAVKDIIRKVLASQGYDLVRTNAKHGAGTMEDAFCRLAKRRHVFNTVVDVGASNGSWSGSLMRYFPLCQYLLIEAQPVHAEALRQFGSDHNNVHYVLAAAGASSGQIFFDATDPLGGQASYTPYGSNNVQIPVTTIDKEVQARNMMGPYLLKFDTHGFEIPILKGAARALSETEVIVMECYNFRIAPECLLFFEMCDYLDGLGFRCIDVIDLMHRPYDQSFWQMDMMFIRKNRPEFLYRSYR
jgi:FkbM family methyltransferase